MEHPGRIPAISEQLRTVPLPSVLRPIQRLRALGALQQQAGELGVEIYGGVLTRKGIVAGALVAEARNARRLPGRVFRFTDQASRLYPED